MKEKKKFKARNLRVRTSPRLEPMLCALGITRLPNEGRYTSGTR